MADLKTARAFLTEERPSLVGEFEVTRPTPNPDECDRAAAGEIVMPKVWDLSPVDPASFDPTEPPGRPEGPVEPPSATSPPTITAVGGLAVGNTLTSTTGMWTGSPTLARQWRRGATNIGGATATTYNLLAADVDLMITCNVTGTNAGGSATATSNALGPIIAAGSDPEDEPPDDPAGETRAAPACRRRK
jgi:hypothetical protein